MNSRRLERSPPTRTEALNLVGRFCPSSCGFNRHSPNRQIQPLSDVTACYIDWVNGLTALRHGNF
ncbi:hypothetical protein H6G89_13290 [Oscillatoria sp. FACHB-1407]|uniref:hypothetical protein n=1 Tax=Oscillatoria sp. FACHB-1407 TaxID=2692847 RepID=UPI001685191A|nr:hypothetical protein [Oscillatoria sp. FACHB-1407]MBD2462023.1 hypothetical protein [Oscillatoria sp. FACHB-1407]